MLSRRGFFSQDWRLRPTGVCGGDPSAGRANASRSRHLHRGGDSGGGTTTALPQACRPDPGSGPSGLSASGTGVPGPPSRQPGRTAGNHLTRAAGKLSIFNSQLRSNLCGHWLSCGLARPQRQVFRQDIDQHQDNHQHRRAPDAPISMRVPPIGTTRMSVTLRRCRRVFRIVLVRSHRVSLKPVSGHIFQQGPSTRESVAAIMYSSPMSRTCTRFPAVSH